MVERVNGSADGVKRCLGAWGSWIKIPEDVFLPRRFSEVTEPP